MLSFCSSPHGLVDEHAVTGATRRPRRTSLPPTTARFATVKRVASLGGKRSFSGGSRRGASTNLKALISQPKDFVHLSHIDGSSTTSSAREIIGIDIDLLQRVVAECNDKQNPTVPAPAPITAIQESQEDLPSPGKDNSACVTPATESISQSAPIGITAVTVDAPDSAADLYKSRRASLIKRKPVPAYDDNWNAISSPVSSSIAASSIPEVAAV